MRAHAIQLDLVWHDRHANHALARAAIEKLKPEAGDLVVLPEMFPVGFSMHVDTIADTAGETFAFLADLAKKFAVFVIGGNVTKPDDHGRNEALVFNPTGHNVAKFTKLHPFSFAREHEHFTGGDGVKLFNWNSLSVAPMICYDLRFPEAFRMGTRQGAQVFVVIANWPTSRVQHWLTLLAARAIENQAYVIGCNRVGHDPNVPAYPGRSVIIDPKGITLADAGDSPGVASAEIDPGILKAYRESFPVLQDMRFI